MSIECPKCHLEHDPVDVIRWLWLFRDTKPKPPGKGGLVPAMLATRMDAKTGCGWTTDADLAELAGCSNDVVQRATRWGRDRLLLHRASKGYRITDERGEKSHWILTDPATQPRISAAMGDGTQPRASAAMAQTHGRTSTRPMAAPAPDPWPHQRGSKAKPEKLNQEALPAARRTTRTGSRGEPAATADDDHPDASHPLEHAAGDPRLVLGELTRGDRKLIDFIIGWFRDEEGIQGGALAARLLQLVGEGKADSLVRWARRALAEQDAAYARTWGPRRAPPCPECGQPYSPRQLADDDFHRKAMAGTAGCVHEEPR